MSSEYSKDKLARLIAEWIDGGLDASGREQLNAMLRASAEARRHYRRQMDLHARLHLECTSGLASASMHNADTQTPRRRSRTVWAVGLAAAACVAIGLLLTWLAPAQEETFATLVEDRAASWEASNLPTSPGSRLGEGTLRLAQGLVTLRFDSGAEVILEGPADITLSSAMEFTLTSGTANATVPESAQGFRIETPTANIIDHGTKFSVTVDPVAGQTFTRVYEGLVDVEHVRTGKTRRLEVGDQAMTSDRGLEGEESSVPAVIGPPARGVDWINVSTNKDAYIGRVYQGGREVHRSESLLLVKNSIRGGSDRNAYLGFDLSDIDRDRIVEAKLRVHMEPTGWGLASHVPDARFSVYGLLTDESWDEDSIKRKGPPVPMKTFRKQDLLVTGKVRHLGSFEVPAGVQSGKFVIEGTKLASFLADHPGDQLTLILVRDTREVHIDGLVHGFASRRHPDLAAPSLAIRLKDR